MSNSDQPPPPGAAAGTIRQPDRPIGGEGGVGAELDRQRRPELAGVARPRATVPAGEPGVGDPREGVEVLDPDCGSRQRTEPASGRVAEHLVAPRRRVPGPEWALAVLG